MQSISEIDGEMQSNPFRRRYPLSQSMTPEAINATIRAMQERMDAVYNLAEKVATLSTAVLAFTLTFAKNLSGGATSSFPITIKLAWLGFLVSIIGCVLVHHSKIDFARRTIAEIRKAGSHLVLVTPPWHFNVGRWLLSIGFLAGVALLVAYGLLSA